MSDNRIIFGLTECEFTETLNESSCDERQLQNESSNGEGKTQKTGKYNILVNENEQQQQQRRYFAFCGSKRYQLAFLACLGFFISTGLRCSIGNVAMECIRNRNNQLTGDDGKDEGILGQMQSQRNLSEPKRCQWSFSDVRTMESAFFWGNVISPLLAGYLATKYPANRVFGFAIAAGALLNILAPVASQIHFSLIVIIYASQGFVEGMIIPASIGLWRYWAPPQENTRLATMSMLGLFVGLNMNWSFSRYLMRFVGWQAPFFIYGIFGILWSILWRDHVHEKPATHPTITLKERIYIENAINTTTINTLPSTPWKSIFKSAPVWAIIISSTVHIWAYFTFSANAAYSGDAYAWDSVSIVWRALHQLIPVLVITIGCFAADSLRSKLTTTIVRKIFNCSSLLIAATFLIVDAYLQIGIISLIFLVLAYAFGSLAACGFYVNHLDIAPQYASILVGVSHTIATASDYTFYFFFERMATIINWQIWYLFCGSISLASCVVYAIFASGEKQQWANPLPNRTESESQQAVATTQPAAESVAPE